MYIEATKKQKDTNTQKHTTAPYEVYNQSTK